MGHFARQARVGVRGVPTAARGGFAGSAAMLVRSGLQRLDEVRRGRGGQDPQRNSARDHRGSCLGPCISSSTVFTSTCSPPRRRGLSVVLRALMSSRAVLVLRRNIMAGVWRCDLRRPQGGAGLGAHSVCHARWSVLRGPPRLAGGQCSGAGLAASAVSCARALRSYERDRYAVSDLIFVGLPRSCSCSRTMPTGACLPSGAYPVVRPCSCFVSGWLIASTL